MKELVKEIQNLRILNFRNPLSDKEIFQALVELNLSDKQASHLTAIDLFRLLELRTFYTPLARPNRAPITSNTQEETVIVHAAADSSDHRVDPNNTTVQETSRNQIDQTSIQTQRSESTAQTGSSTPHPKPNQQASTRVEQNDTIALSPIKHVENRETRTEPEKVARKVTFQTETEMASAPSELQRIYRDLRKLGYNHDDALEQAQIDAAGESTNNHRTAPPIAETCHEYPRQRLGAPNTDPSRPFQLARALSDIPYFSGMTDSAKFEVWLPSIEKAFKAYEIADDHAKIKALYNKLNPPALDYLDDFQKNNPIRGRVYANVIEFLRGRFPENTAQYRSEFKNCSRKIGETLGTFAWRLTKLFDRVHPTTDGDPRTREKFLINAFLEGLSSNLRKKLDKKLKRNPVENLTELVDLAEEFDTDDDDREEPLTRELINMIKEKSKPSDAQEMLRTMTEQMANTLKDVTSHFTQSLELITKKLDRQPSVRFSDRTSSGKPQDSKTPFCEFHKFPGHRTEDCVIKKKLANATCGLCSKRGHVAKFCREKSDESDNTVGYRRQSEN